MEEDTIENIIYTQFVDIVYTGDDSDESRWLKKKIRPSKLEKPLSSLVDYMIDSSPDELNEQGYTPE